MSFLDIQLRGVLDRGIPNKERIALYVAADASTEFYSILLGISQGPERAVIIRDNLFWMGKLDVTQGDWLFIYTGKGSGARSKIPNTPNHLISLYWNREETIFHDKNIVPLLITFDGINIDHVDNMKYAIDYPNSDTSPLLH